ncbi:uncharacterized protein LOC111717542 [Eurytemora carolleeae]|uniref:uncharacterized protein LOC111717542 n=1 Tax=Eurytemora carolleeae TaxID=1294199 RepID=UPI000C7933EB|nr:uncharacterized protein LOC111717542 [Eurytemora carolleeae]|eukprot:XP_023348803.1 uncharacterized protein LOC111717542 [Eurytemora affinis]
MPYVCLVCGNETVKLLYHYGSDGNICNSCRIFFRRSVSQNLKRICKTELFNCPIATNARVGCKLCRFNKCIQVGMKPEQVDKTKKAIIAYFAEEEKNSGKNEALTSPTDSPFVNIEEEKVIDVDFMIDNQVITQPLFVDPKRNQSAIVEGGGLLIKNPKLFHMSINNQLNPEDVQIFSGVVTSWRKLLLKIYEDGMSYNFVQQEMDKIHDQTLDVQSLTYDPALDCTLVDLAVDNILSAVVKDIFDLDPSVQTNFKTLYQCYYIFYSSAKEGTTMRQSLATFGFNVESYPFSAIMPVHIHDMKIVDFMKSDMFKSPWAESLEVEEFFVKTCQTLKTFLADPVINLLYQNLVFFNSIVECENFLNFLPGKLKMILYKEMLKKSQDSNLANHRFTQLISTINDVEECARILERASLIKETHIDLQDIDVSPLE